MAMIDVIFGTNRIVRQNDLPFNLRFLKIHARPIAIISCGKVESAQMLNVFLIAIQKSESCNRKVKLLIPLNSEVPSGSHLKKAIYTE